MSCLAAGAPDRVVRFDDECVLIPESRSRRPRMLTKSYSLPLWKRKPPASSTSDSEQEENSVVFRVPVPSFMSKPHSPSRHREFRSQPLPSCLVHRETSSVGTSRINRWQSRRSPSLPPTPPQHITTIPLRSCCTDCGPIIEHCLNEGSAWQEKFSRGARRRRTMSLDTSTSHEFGTVACNNAEAVVSSSFSGVLAINVDEVDNHRSRRRMSFEEDEAKRVWQDMSGHLDRERSSSNGSTSSGHCRIGSDPGSGSAKSEFPRVVPIEEEDEDQLFPLPSPRRSPSVSPTPSPNGSTSCLYGSALSSSPRTSKDSLLNMRGRRSTSSSEDSHSSLPKMRCDKGLLTPDPSPTPPHSVPSGLKGLSASPNHSSPSLLQSSPAITKRHASPSVFSSSLHTRTSPITFSQKPSKHPLSSSSSTNNYLPPSPTSPEPSAAKSISRKRSRGPSFSMPKPASLLKAGAEVLKGVGSMNGGNINGQALSV